MKTERQDPNPRLDKCECNHFRYGHWGNKGKCLEINYGIGSQQKCKCNKFILKEKDKGLIFIIEE